MGFKETEIGLIPDDWEVKKIGDIFDVKQGKQLSSKENSKGKSKQYFLRTSNVFWGGIKIDKVDTMYFTQNEFKKLKLNKGDILVCEGGDIGRTAIFNENMGEYAFQNHLHRLRIKENNIFDYFFIFWMEFAITLKKYYIYNANRTTIPNLSATRLKDFEIPLPPINEQRKIAKMLFAIQEAKEKTQAVIDAVKKVKKSLMKYLFKYGPVPVEEADKVKLKETEIGEIPEDWEVVEAEKIFNRVTDGTHDTPKKQEKGYKLVTAKQLRMGTIDLTKTDYFISEKDFENVNKRSKVDKYDILITMIGANTGDIALVEEEPDYAVKNIGIFKNNGDSIFSKFASYWLQTNNSQKFVKNNLSGTSQGYIPLTKLRIFPIVNAKNAVQSQIIKQLDVLVTKLQAEEAKKQALEKLFKSLLNNLMTGKIRVKDLEI